MLKPQTTSHRRRSQQAIRLPTCKARMLASPFRSKVTARIKIKTRSGWYRRPRRKPPKWSHQKSQSMKVQLMIPAALPASRQADRRLNRSRLKNPAEIKEKISSRLLARPPQSPQQRARQHPTQPANDL